MNNKRNSTADLLKGIAVVLMILVHVVEKFSTNHIQASKGGRFVLFLGGPPVAPVFMVLMGFYIASSNKTNSQLARRGIYLLLGGFLLNIAINTNLFISINNGVFNIDPLPYLFGVDIFHFAGLSIIILSLLRSVFLKNTKSIVLSIVLVGLLNLFLVRFSPINSFWKYIGSFFYGYSNWAYFPIIPWLAYPLIGFLFFKLDYKKIQQFIQPSSFNLAIIVVFIIFGIWTINYAIDVSANLQAFYHHDGMFFIWTLIFIIGYSLFVERMNSLLGKFKLLLFLKWLGNNLTIIYIVQWILIGNLTTVLYNTINSPIVLALYSIAILLIAALLGFLFNQIKLNHQAIQIKNRTT
jgi:hypothetical protein